MPWSCFSPGNYIALVGTLFKMFKWIVSRDFRCPQMILMDKIGVPDVSLKVYFFVYFFILFLKFLSFQR